MYAHLPKYHTIRVETADVALCHEAGCRADAFPRSKTVSGKEAEQCVELAPGVRTFS